jgi:hypothetical protein
VLALAANNLSGTLPPAWGANGTSLRGLMRLDVRQNALTGYLPDVWGSGFQVSFGSLSCLAGTAASTFGI